MWTIASHLLTDAIESPLIAHGAPMRKQKSEVVLRQGFAALQIGGAPCRDASQDAIRPVYATESAPRATQSGVKMVGVQLEAG